MTQLVLSQNKVFPFENVDFNPQNLSLKRFSVDRKLNDLAVFYGFQEIQNPCLTKYCRIYDTRANGLFIPYLDIKKSLDKGLPVPLAFVPTPSKNEQKNANFKQFLKVWQTESFNDYQKTYARFRVDKPANPDYKYLSNAFSDSKQFFWASLLVYLFVSGKSLDQIKTFYLTEGEIKAFIAGFCGVPIVGIGGINNIPDFAILKQIMPNLATIIMIYDNDAYDLSEEGQILRLYGQGKKFEDKRQKSFFSSAKSLAKSAKINGLKFAIATPKIFEDSQIKGLDDVFLAHWDKREAISKSLFTGEDNRYFAFESFKSFEQKLKNLSTQNHFSVFGKTITKPKSVKHLEFEEVKKIIIAHCRAAMHAPTGVGKTFLLTQLIPFLTKKFKGKIFIVQPRVRLLENSMNDLKEVCKDFKTVAIYHHSEFIQKAFDEAEIVFITPISFQKIYSLLDLENDFFYVDEADCIDLDLLKDSVSNYTNLLKNAKNLLFTTATPNYGLLRDIGMKDVFNYHFEALKDTNHFHIVKSKKGKLSSLIAQLKQLCNDTQNKQVVYCNDINKGEQLSSYLQKQGIDAVFVDTENPDANEIVNTGYFKHRVTIVTKWLSYGINIWEKYLDYHIFQTSHPISFSEIIQFAGRGRLQEQRNIYLYLNNYQNDYDCETRYYFEQKQATNIAKLLNEAQISLSNDLLNFAKPCIQNLDLGTWQPNELFLSLSIFQKIIQSSTKVLQGYLEFYGQSSVLDLDCEKIVFESHLGTPLSIDVSTLCQNANIGIQDVLESSELQDNLEPKNRKTFAKIANLLRQIPEQIPTVSENILAGLYDSNKQLGTLYTELKIRIVQQSKCTKSVDYVAKNILANLKKEIDDDFSDNQHDYIEFRARDILELSSKYLLSNHLQKTVSEKSIVLTFLKIHYDVSYKKVRVGKQTQMTWIVKKKTFVDVFGKQFWENEHGIPCFWEDKPCS